jgi:hypothetical protein
MSTSGISSSLLSQTLGTTSAANQFVTDLNQVVQDLQEDNVKTAQQDYVTLSQDALNSARSSTATSSTNGVTTAQLSDVASSSSSSNAFVTELNQLGTDLQNGDVASGQGDVLALGSTAQDSATLAGASSGSSSNSTGAVAAGGPASQADRSALIRAAVEAIRGGDNSAVGTSLSELASLSTNSAGGNALAGESANYGSSSSSTSLYGSTSQQLESLNSGSSNSSASSLDLLA